MKTRKKTNKSTNRRTYTPPTITMVMSQQEGPLCADTTVTVIPDEEYGDYNDETINAKWGSDWGLWEVWNLEDFNISLNSKLK